MDSTNADEFVLDANTALDIARCPKAGRNLVLGPRAQKECLKADLFVSAEKRGDQGTALRTASLGSVYGLDSFMDQNMGYVTVADASVGTGVTDNAEAAGSTVVETTVVASAADIKAGCYVVFEGDGKPYRISSIANDPIDITLTEGLRDAVAAGADVTVYKSGLVDLVAGYAAGWAKEITVDDHEANKGPQAGQWVMVSGSRSVLVRTRTRTPSSRSPRRARPRATSLSTVRLTPRSRTATTCSTVPLVGSTLRSIGTHSLWSAVLWRLSPATWVPAAS